MYESGVYKFNDNDKNQGGVIISKDGLYPELLEDLNNNYKDILGFLPKSYFKSLTFIMPNAHYVLPLKDKKYIIDNDYINDVIKRKKLNYKFNFFRDDDVKVSSKDKNKNRQEIILPIYIKGVIEAIFIVDVDISCITKYINNYNDEMYTQYEVENKDGLLTQKIEVPYAKNDKEYIYIGLNLFDVMLLIFKLYLIIECMYQILCRMFTFFYKRIMYDSMTHCLRRNIFDMKYKTLSSRSVIIFDIDHFKLINDNFGHAIGDHVIGEIGKMLQQQARKHHLYFRWGGEEFLILLPKTNKKALLDYAEILRHEVESMTLLDGNNVTISLGTSEQKPKEHIYQTIYRADMALYQAKELGRNKSHYL
ncbi:GGDEF domain-containing protein [Photobacterium angustum]|uniref:diguanylate cyclase n=1 Tax=Photobacterium angustum TaxID=661 RepID=A0A2S7VHX6_PHOAN|nr:GGDEF domain-containing protein [Photobacterium angustum]PQJ61796.1 hypothetical protein BTO08_16085 [Photobacterium angustum]